MIKHKDSHIDHGLTDMQLGYVIAKAEESYLDDFREYAASAHEHGRPEPTSIGVRSYTVTLPEWLGTVPCALRGPLVGDPPIIDDAIVFATRGSRPYPSRMIALPMIQTRKVTVIAGPHDGHDLVLYTAFGGPKAPREVGELEAKITHHENIAGVVPDALIIELAQSRDFWNTHALAIEEEPKFFTWVAEFTVNKTWVEDGFDLTDERARGWLTDDLSYAYGRELTARVLKAPDADLVARTQGYKSAAERDAERSR